jgi:hypothetical protein
MKDADMYQHKKRPDEDTGRGWLSVSHGETPQEKPNLSTP